MSIMSIAKIHWDGMGRYLVTKRQVFDTGTDFDYCARDTVAQDLRVVDEEASVCLVEI